MAIRKSGATLVEEFERAIYRLQCAKDNESNRKVTDRLRLVERLRKDLIEICDFSIS